MSLTKVNPSSAPPPMAPPPRYAWEQEKTLVQRRNTLPRRIRRFIGKIWLPVLILVIVVAALTNADVMRALQVPLQFLGRFVFAAFFIMFQFVAMFWFLGRARMYTIWPGAEGVSFRDYRGQPEILDQAKQVVQLLRGVRVFEEAGGEPLNGLLLEGPPGTGKTWLAQAISTEAGVPFFYVDASSMNSMFMGIAPLKVANLYRKARKALRALEGGWLKSTRKAMRHGAFPIGRTTSRVDRGNSRLRRSVTCDARQGRQEERGHDEA